MRRYVFVLGRKIIKKKIGSCLAVALSLFPLCSTKSNCLFVRVFSCSSVAMYNLQDVFKNCSVTNQSCTNEFTKRCSKNSTIQVLHCICVFCFHEDFFNGQTTLGQCVTAYPFTYFLVVWNFKLRGEFFLGRVIRAQNP